MGITPNPESMAQSNTAVWINSVYAVGNLLYEIYFSLYKSDFSFAFVLVLLFFPITFPIYLLTSAFN